MCQATYRVVTVEVIFAGILVLRNPVVRFNVVSTTGQASSG